jgi:spermidine synthase
MKKYLLYLTVFIVGAVILVLEILGTRIIAPYYGTTIYVWSSLIGVTLLALSLGYYFGGRLADKKPMVDFLYLIIFLAALSIVMIPLIMNFVLVGVNFLGPRFGALTSAVLLFAIPLLLLGMVAPYAIKLKTQELGKIGITAGNLYGIATVGSFVGAILTGFYLIPGLGINSIIYLIGGALVLLVAPYGINSKKKLFSFGAVLIFLLVIVIPQIMSADLGSEKFNVVYETESAYSRLKVIDMGDTRYLVTDGAVENVYNLKTREFGFDYLKLLEKAVWYHSNPEDVLMLGLGAGGIDMMLEGSGVEVDNVEIDSEVVGIARDYFDFDGNVIINDGRNYVRNIDKKYDVVLLDVYGGYSIYPYLFSVEAFWEIKDILTDDGILSINVISYETGNYESDDRLVTSIDRTLREVFGNVYAKSTGTGLTNIVFYASDTELNLDDEFIDIKVLSTRDDSGEPSENALVLTDDYNPIETFSLDMVEESQDYIREGIGNELL